MCNCSLDYLITAIKMLSVTTYVSRISLRFRIAAFNQGSPLLENGLLAVKKMGGDRAVLHYRLTRPYAQLKVKDLMTPTYPDSPYIRQLMTLCADRYLCDLGKITFNGLTAKQSYGSENIFHLLHGLHSQADAEIPSRLLPCLSAILRDMQNNGIVEISPTGYAYQLAIPLSRLRVCTLLPYLYTNCSDSKYLNALLYAAKNYPVISIMDKVITKNQ